MFSPFCDSLLHFPLFSPCFICPCLSEAAGGIFVISVFKEFALFGDEKKEYCIMRPLNPHSLKHVIPFCVLYFYFYFLICSF